MQWSDAVNRIPGTHPLIFRPDACLESRGAREREILTLIATGTGNKAIAQRLGLTEKTVRNNVSNTFAKLRVADRAAAVARARDAGLGTTAHDV